MSNSVLKQAALDHLAEERVAAFSLPLGDDLFVCAGTKEEIAKLVAPDDARDAARYRWLRQFEVDSYMASGQGDKLDAEIDHAIAATPPQAKEEE